MGKRSASSPVNRNPFPASCWGYLFVLLAKGLLHLRYRLRIQGLREVARQGTAQILFLPNHPAFIDPIIVLALLYRRFRPRSLADEYQMNRPVVSFFSRRLGVRNLPNLERRGIEGVDPTRSVLQETMEGLGRGENLLLYPSGRVKHQKEESIGAASAVKAMLTHTPEARIVLIRQNGLWGSRFSFGFNGRRPKLGQVFFQAIRILLQNGLFFMPRRQLVFEFVEPADFPREADLLAMNRWMEEFYNREAQANTYVPYEFWEQGGTRTLPEPAELRMEGELDAVPESLRRQVLQKIAEQSGHPAPQVRHFLAQDLGMDSLAIAELVLWLEKEYGHALGTPESLKTVGDVILAAVGKGYSALEFDLLSPSPRWYRQSQDDSPLPILRGETITEVFLKQAGKNPQRTIAVDQRSGEISYRRMIAAIFLFKPLLQQASGPYLGIMLPASVGATLVYISALFAGKTPVMLNWTTGSRHLRHSVDLLGISKVITSRDLIRKLASQGLDLQEVEPYFLFVEDMRQKFSSRQRILALCRSYIGRASLAAPGPPETAVVLFTSGSENLPKAVPLSHTNLLSNLFAVAADIIPFRGGDIFLGMLPPFHSFGLTANILSCLCLGIPTVFHPNPTEATLLAALTGTFRATILVGTPTFLNGIVRAARPGQLASLRMAITGAEKCPDAVYRALGAHCPQARILEGYGITECSPIISANRWDRQVPGSIGWLLPNFESLLVHPETLAPVAPGETGLLLVRGPCVFSGYLHHEGESPFVAVQDHRWYRTGDLVRRDSGGVLFFEGRLKRFVKLGGEMISLPAIESVLSNHYPPDEKKGPQVAVESLSRGEDPEITLFACSPLDRSWVNQLLHQAGLSPLHNIRQIIRVDSIPLLGSGKIHYRALKELYAPRR